MPVTFQEHYDSSEPDGTAITTSNTGHSNVILTGDATAEFDTALAHTGTRSARVDAGTGGVASLRVMLSHPTKLYATFYVYVDTAPAGNCSVIEILDPVGASCGYILMHATGNCRLRDENGANIGGQLSLAGAGAWTRVDLEYNQDTSTVTGSAFHGPGNTDGSTPDDTETGAYTFSGTFDRIEFGINVGTQPLRTGILNYDSIGIADDAIPGVPPWASGVTIATAAANVPVAANAAAPSIGASPATITTAAANVPVAANAAAPSIGASPATITTAAANVPIAASIAAPSIAAPGTGTIQQHYRIRSDDGQTDNADAGWAAPLDTDAAIDLETPFGLRFEIVENAGTSTGNIAYRLQSRYKPFGGSFGAWADVPVESNVNEEDSSASRVCVGLSAGATDGTATTNVLVGAAEAFVAGSVETGGTGLIAAAATTATVLLQSQHTEFEFRCRIHHFSDGPAVTSVGDDFEFRLVEDIGGTLLDGYTATPTVTVGASVGIIGGTMVEAPNRVGPFEDGNANLYVLLEYALTANELLLAKSVDGGDTWTEAQPTGRPPTTINDIESCDARLVGDTLHIAIQGPAGDDAYYITYDVSSHATTPDTWQITDELVTATGNPLHQNAAIEVRGDGSVVVAYCEVDTQDHVAYRIRAPGGGWGTPVIINQGDGDTYNHIVSCMEPGTDTTWFFYWRDDGVDGTIFYRTLTSADSLSAESTLETGLSTAGRYVHPTLPPVAYETGGTQCVLVVWTAVDDTLHSVQFTDGTPGTEQVAVNDNVDRSFGTSHQAVAGVTLDGTTAHLFYSPTSDNDLWHVQRAHDGSWGSADEVIDGVTVHWVRPELVTGGVGLFWDAGSDGGTGFGRYATYTIAGQSVTVTTAAVGVPVAAVAAPPAGAAVQVATAAVGVPVAAVAAPPVAAPVTVTTAAVGVPVAAVAAPPAGGAVQVAAAAVNVPVAAVAAPPAAAAAVIAAAAVNVPVAATAAPPAAASLVVTAATVAVPVAAEPVAVQAGGVAVTTAAAAVPVTATVAAPQPAPTSIPAASAAVVPVAASAAAPQVAGAPVTVTTTSAGVPVTAAAAAPTAAAAQITTTTTAVPVTATAVTPQPAPLATATGTTNVPVAAAAAAPDVVTPVAVTTAAAAVPVTAVAAPPTIGGSTGATATWVDTTRPHRWTAAQRPHRWTATFRPDQWTDTTRRHRWTSTTRPRQWPDECVRPHRWSGTIRPHRWSETVFLREGDANMAVALNFVDLGDYTQGEIPEPLLVRVMETPRDSAAAPRAMPLFNQTPAWTATVTITGPGAVPVATDRVVEIVDPADMVSDYPNDITAAVDDEGWLRLAWAAGDLDIVTLTAGNDQDYEVQLRLDNGTLRLKSTDIWRPKVRDGVPLAAVGA